MIPVLIPKCATNSIFEDLKLIKHNHNTLAKQKEIGLEGHTFTFVRNTYRRLLSFYQMFVNYNGTKEEFKSWVTNGFDKGNWDSISTPLYRTSTQDDKPHALKTYIEDISYFDFIGRVENYDADMVQLKQELGYTDLSTSHVGGPAGMPPFDFIDYQDWWDAEMISVVENDPLLNWELETFGYNISNG